MDEEDVVAHLADAAQAHASHGLVAAAGRVALVAEAGLEGRDHEVAPAQPVKQQSKVRAVVGAQCPHFGDVDLHLELVHAVEEVGVVALDVAGQRILTALPP